MGRMRGGVKGARRAPSGPGRTRKEPGVGRSPPLARRVATVTVCGLDFQMSKSGRGFAPGRTCLGGRREKHSCGRC